MQPSSPQITIPLWRPLPLRLWRAVADTVHAAGFAVLQAWQAHRQRQHERRAWSGLSDLGSHTLKDIGAPDWVVLDAADRSDTARRRLDDMRGWHGL